LALGRAADHPDIGPGQKTLVAGLAVYVGGFLAIWANRQSMAILLMLSGLAVVLVGALMCGGFPA
jgi:hypothetical protein